MNWHQPDIILMLTVFLVHVDGLYTHLNAIAIEITYTPILPFPEVKNSSRDFSIGILKALANEDTLLRRTHCCSWCFLGFANCETNICCGHKMFLNKIRSIFVPRTQNWFVSVTNIARAGKRGNICVGNNVSATMCPRLPVPYEISLCLISYHTCVKSIILTRSIRILYNLECFYLRRETATFTA